MYLFTLQHNPKKKEIPIMMSFHLLFQTGQDTGITTQFQSFILLYQDLPHGICAIGDAAFEPTENIIPIYQGAEPLKEKYDNLNFYASQLCIRIEMTFGIMTKKWEILTRPLTISLCNVKWHLQAVARLHNFVINEQLRMTNPANTENDPNINPPANNANTSYLPTKRMSIQ